MRIFGSVILVALGLYLSVVGFLYYAQESFLFQPAELGEDFQFSFKHEFQEINLESEDGSKLNALHFRVNNAKGVILYFHGNAGNLQRWGEIVQFHADLGYDVIVMDYRRYGKSSGKWSYESFLSDADMFYQYVMDRYDERNIVLYGRSLGTGFASWVASRNNPSKLILESPYTSVADMGNYFYPLAPAQWLIRYNFSPREYLKEASCPIYIFHGTNDIIVPYDIGNRLYETFKDSKSIQLISVNGGGHNDLVEFELFRKEIRKILN